MSVILPERGHSSGFDNTDSTLFSNDVHLSLEMDILDIVDNLTPSVDKNVFKYVKSNKKINDISVLCLYLYPNLQELELNKNQICGPLSGNFLPGSITHLNLANNKVTSLCEMDHLENLQNLDVSHNEIFDISGYHLPQNLVNLKLGYNRLIRLDTMKRLNNLHSLDLNGNKLKDVNGKKLPFSLEYLSMRNNQIVVVENIEQLPLKHLDMSWNKLTKICELPDNLEDLNLTMNNIDEFTDLSHLFKLKHINAGDNNIKKVDGSKLPMNIQFLNLANNKVNELHNMQQLKHLKELDLSDNCLTEIYGPNLPPNVVDIYLIGNQITKLQDLHKLDKIETLAVDDNKISELEMLPVSLSFISFAANPLVRVSIKCFSTEPMCNLVTQALNDLKISATINRQKVMLQVPPLQLLNTGYNVITEYFNLHHSRQAVLSESKPTIDGEITRSSFYNVSKRANSILLQCKFVATKPQTIVRWYRDKKSPDLENTSILTESGFSWFMINTPTPFDSGLYECVLTNSFGEASAEINLKILGFPIITSALEDQELVLGDELKLQCQYTALEAEVNWYKDGNILPSHFVTTIDTEPTSDLISPSSETVLGDSFTSQLVISSVESTHYGRYKCNVTSPYGFQATECQVKLLTLKDISEEIKNLLKNEDNFIGLACFEEKHILVKVDVHDDGHGSYDKIKCRIEAHFKKNIREKYIRVIRQKYKWEFAAVKITSDYTHTYFGTVADARAKVRTTNNKEGTFYMTCKHVLRPDDKGTQGDIYISTGDCELVRTPLIMSTLAKARNEFLVDVALIADKETLNSQVDVNHPNDMITDQDREKKDVDVNQTNHSNKVLCQTGGCRHLSKGHKVKKDGIMTGEKEGTIEDLAYYIHFKEHWGYVCVISGQNDFAEKGDSGCLVCSDHNEHIIGLFCGIINDYNTSLVEETKEYLRKKYIAVAYLDECILELKRKYDAKIQNIEVCFGTECLGVCKD